MPRVRCEESLVVMDRNRERKKSADGKKKESFYCLIVLDMSEHTAGHLHASSVAGFEDLFQLTVS